MNNSVTLPNTTGVEVEEARRNAEHLRALEHSTGHTLPTDTEITVRVLHAEDTAAIERLAGLDSASAPSGALLGAEIDGRLVAAISLASGQTIADPFRAASSHAVQILRLRAKQLDAPKGASRLKRLADALGRGNAHAGLAGSPPGAGGRLLEL